MKGADFENGKDLAPLHFCEAHKDTSPLQASHTAVGDALPLSWGLSWSWIPRASVLVILEEGDPSTCDTLERLEAFLPSFCPNSSYSFAKQTLTEHLFCVTCR